MKLPKGTYFVPGPGNKKYTAVVPGHGKISFGDRRYQQFRDSVPKSLGGGLYTHLNHSDRMRRANYRRRHGAQGYQNKIYSPSWFSWHFLW